jgi:hypothetical protein
MGTVKNEARVIKKASRPGTSPHAAEAEAADFDVSLMAGRCLLVT